jgi:hypothetical protein
MISEGGANQERNSMEPKDLKQRTDEVDELLDEADQIVAITVSSIKTARRRKR